MANAVTISGEATKACVLELGHHSRFAKFLLKEVMMVFFRFGIINMPCPLPMQGPQALANTTPPISSKYFDKSISFNGITNQFTARV